MNKFSIGYPEYHIAGLLQGVFTKKNNFSVCIPLSRQQKNFDLLLFNEKNKKCISVQVKSSRTYLSSGKSSKKVTFDYNAWFNRFQTNQYTDFYMLFISYPLFNPVTFKPLASFDTKILVFDKNEMNLFISQVKTKKGTPDSFFGFGFNINFNGIFGTRGFINQQAPDYSQNLFSNKLAAVKKAII